jgi:hypothetical protein
VSGFRTFVNENQEFLISSTPVSDVFRVNDKPVTIPQWVDGAGWNSDVVLVNTTENTLNGEVRFLDQSGNPTEVGIGDESSGASVLEYVIAPRSAQRFTTSGTSAKADFPVNARSTAALRTPGTNFNQISGYALADLSTAVSGLQLVEYRKDNVTHSQAGLLSSSPVRIGRVFVEVTNSIKTQLSIANPSGVDANIDLFFTDSTGASSSFVSVTVPAHGQFSGNVGDSAIPIPGTSGTISFTASVPVSVTALRNFTNENTLSIISPVPVADVNVVRTQPASIPHFVDGAGWSTDIVLVNTTENAVTGEVRFMSQDGGPLDVAMNGGGAASVLGYTVPPRSFQRIQTAGTADEATIGSIQIVPFGGTVTPFAYAALNLKSSAATVMQNVVSGQVPASRVRFYAEAFGDFDARLARSTRTAVALANPTSAPLTVSITLTGLDGTALGTSSPVQIPANGQVAVYLNSLIPAATAPFRGIATVNVLSGAGVTAIGFRAMNNERGDFLAATTGPLAEPTSGRIVFPYITDGSGYSSQFFIVGNEPFNGGFHYIAQDGSALFIDAARVGSVQVVPFAGTFTPESHVILSHKELGITKLQTYVAGDVPGMSSRMFVENIPGFETGVPGSARTGVAFANPGSVPATLRLDLTNFNGVVQASTTTQIPAKGEVAVMVNDLPGFSTIPQTFQGVLKLTVVSGSGVTSSSFRASYNATGNLLVTTTGPLNENAGIPGLLVFPHIAEGGGYITRFIILAGSSGQSNAGVLRFFNDAGGPVNLVLSGQ